MPFLKCLCVLMSCLAAGNVAASEDQTREIGWVLEFEPPQAVHLIHMNAPNNAIEVKAGTTLHAGDVLNVQSNGRVLVALADGSEHEISGNGSWKVPSPRTRSAIWKVMQSVLGLLDRQGEIATSAVSRGVCVLSPSAEPLSVPVLSNQQKVVDGRQTLTFELHGGCPPFTVTLEGTNSTIEAVPSVESRRYAFRDVVLTPGEYNLRVRDADGSEALEAFQVVEEALSVPTSLSAKSPTLRQLAEAMWLSEQEEDSWRLESAKRLGPLVEEGQPIAVRMAEVLLHDPR